jgi:hypothetical protein
MGCHIVRITQKFAASIRRLKFESSNDDGESIHAESKKLDRWFVDIEEKHVAGAGRFWPWAGVSEHRLHR